MGQCRQFSALVLSCILGMALVACDKDQADLAQQPSAQMDTRQVDQGSLDAQKSAEGEKLPVPLAKPLSLAEGKKRYEATCRMCHDSGLLDAPRLGHASDWVGRTEQGVEILYKHSAQGVNKMPAQAVNGVSEAEVYAAVDYMLSQLK